MDEMTFKSSLLAQVRELERGNSILADAIGEVAQFRLVIDANIVVSELLHRIRYPERQTAVEELIQSTVFVVVAPTWLETELKTSALPQTAARRGVPLESLEAQWAEYRKLLIWDATIPEADLSDTTVLDPKDLPYVVAQLRHDACGVLSKDPHVAKMGGTQLSFDFILSARTYARTVVISVGIRVSGRMLGMLAAGALVEGVKGSAKLISKLPPRVQVALAAAAIVAMLHPKSRAWMLEKAERLFEVLAPVLAGIGEAIVRGKELAEQKEAAATLLLEDTRRQVAEAAAKAVIVPAPLAPSK